MIPVYVLAVGLVCSVRAKPIGLNLRRIMGRASNPHPEGLKAEDILEGGGAYTLMVRVTGILLSIAGLVAMWITIHAAMSPGASH